MSLLMLLKSAKDTYFSWSAIKGHFRHGVSGTKYSGYEAGRLARYRALMRKSVRARLRADRAQERVDEFLRSEAERKAQAREGA